MRVYVQAINRNENELLYHLQISVSRHRYHYRLRSLSQSRCHYFSPFALGSVAGKERVWTRLKAATYTSRLSITFEEVLFDVSYINKEIPKILFVFHV